MKVHQRGSTSPSPLLESVNGDSNYFNFQLEAHHIVKGKRGQKVFVCDLCSPPGSIFKRSFSLKRHYLRFHINFAFLSPRDLSNCAIATNGKLQRSGCPTNQLNGKVVKTPLIYRCHKCGGLVKTKDDLISHLETHLASSNGADDNTIDGEKRGTNRCPRCSTAFSLRKTLMRHIKKNRCRGGSLASSPESMQDSKSETDANDTENSCTMKIDELSPANGYEDDDEVMDFEISAELGCTTSLFRFACILCAKLFDSYVNMCRHRRLTHGRYGVCSPQRLVTRKLFQSSGSLYEMPNVPSSRLLATSQCQDYEKFIHNAHDNSTRYIEGKFSTAIHSADCDIFASHDEEEKVFILSSRWSWGRIDYNIEELHRLDIPVQKAFYTGLQAWKVQQQVPQETEDKPTVDDCDVFAYLNLCPKKVEALDRYQDGNGVPELSGEWIRVKSYICLPCGQKFLDFYKLLDHQHSNHSGVWCTHIQLDQSWESEDLVKVLKKETTRSGNGQSSSTESYECSKCQFKVNSLPELHSHILLCSNHASTPTKKRLHRSNSNGKNEKRTAVNGRSRGMLRQFLRSNALNKANRAKEEKSSEKEASNQDNRKGAKQITKAKKSEQTLRTHAKANVSANKKSKTKTEQLAPASKKRINGLTEIHQCIHCKRKLKSQSSLLNHQNYCRRRPKNSKLKQEKRKIQEPVNIESPPRKKTRAAKKSEPAPKVSKAEKVQQEAPKESGRPVRSNRAVPENIVESSFLKALSAEQRKRVSNNTCPFCLKHYTYKSNFRKHLIEGCNTSNDDIGKVVEKPTRKGSAVKDRKGKTKGTTPVIKQTQKKTEKSSGTTRKKPTKGQETKARKLQDRQAKKTVRTI